MAKSKKDKPKSKRDKKKVTKKDTKKSKKKSTSSSDSSDSSESSKPDFSAQELADTLKIAETFGLKLVVKNGSKLLYLLVGFVHELSCRSNKTSD